MIRKNAGQLDVAFRTVIYGSDWTLGRPKAPDRAKQVSFESVFCGRTATSRSIRKFPCETHISPSGQTAAERAHFRRREARQRAPKGPKRYTKVDFDAYFRSRNARSSSICKFTAEMDVSLRPVIYSAKWTSSGQKGTLVPDSVTFESVFHDRTAPSSLICKFQCELDFLAPGQTVRE